MACNPHAVAPDPDLVARVDTLVAETTGITRRAMFGGMAWMLDGRMACGVVGDDLVARIGDDAVPSALDMPGTRPMDFTGRVMRAYVFVGPEGTRDDGDLSIWVERCLAFAASLPPRPPGD